MTRNSKFSTRIASLAFVAIAALTSMACVVSSDKPESIAPVTQASDCADIQDLLDKAIGDAAEANADADESRGTPDGASDADKAEAAEALVDELIDQKEECASAASTTSTSTSTTTTVATPNVGPTTTSTPSEEAIAEFGETISVVGEDLRPQDRCQQANFLDNSLRDVEAGDPDFRQTTDASSTPFLEKTDELKELELYLEDCGNPTLGDMSIQGLDTLKDEVWGSIRDHNPWMTECLDLAEEPGLRDAFLDDNFQAVKADWSLCAALVNKLIRDADLIGVVTERSASNWHLPGPQAGGLPRTELNPRQENLPVLMFEYTAKDYGCVWRFGYNLQDKRFETFPCGPPEPPPCTENCGGGTPTTTTVVEDCPDKRPTRLPDGSCVLTVTTTPRDTSPTTPPNTVSNTVPATAPPDTTPVPPTTHDFVPPPVTAQNPNGPPVQGTPPTTVAPQPTAP